MMHQGLQQRAMNRLCLHSENPCHEVVVWMLPLCFRFPVTKYFLSTGVWSLLSYRNRRFNFDPCLTPQGVWFHPLWKVLFQPCAAVASDPFSCSTRCVIDGSARALVLGQRRGLGGGVKETWRLPGNRERVPVWIENGRLIHQPDCKRSKGQKG